MSSWLNNGQNGNASIIKLGAVLVIVMFMMAWLGNITVEISELRQAFLDEHRAVLKDREELIFLRGRINQLNGKTENGFDHAKPPAPMPKGPNP